MLGEKGGPGGLPPVAIVGDFHSNRHSYVHKDVRPVTTPSPRIFGNNRSVYASRTGFWKLIRLRETAVMRSAYDVSRDDFP